MSEQRRRRSDFPSHSHLAGPVVFETPKAGPGAYHPDPTTENPWRRQPDATCNNQVSIVDVAPVVTLHERTEEEAEVEQAIDALALEDPIPVARLAVEIGYESLAMVLDDALAQAQGGKGKERHATGQPFHEQPIVRIGELLGNDGFELGQAIKKLQESCRLTPERARAERLGAINYIAASILMLDAKKPG